MAIPLEWKASIQGAEDVKNKLNDINKAFSEGTISELEYARSKRELAQTSRVLAGSLAQNKNILLATYPALNKVSQAMSIANRVSHGLMSVFNTLNLAQLAFASTSEQQERAQERLAKAQQELIKAYASGDPNKIAEAQKEVADAMDDLIEATKRAKDQMVQNWFALGSSVIFTISTMSTAMMQFLGTQKGMALATRLSTLGMGASFGMAGLAIGAFLATVYGGNEILKLLLPQYAKTAEDTANRIQKTWNVDSVTAWFLQPWVQAYFGVLKIWNEMTIAFNQFSNLWIVGINKLIESLTFGLVKNAIKELPMPDLKKVVFKSDGTFGLTTSRTYKPSMTQTGTSGITGGSKENEDLQRRIREWEIKIQSNQKLTEKEMSQYEEDMAKLQNELNDNTKVLDLSNTQTKLENELQKINNEQTLELNDTFSTANITMEGLSENVEVLTKNGIKINTVMGGVMSGSSGGSNLPGRYQSQTAYMGANGALYSSPESAAANNPKGSTVTQVSVSGDTSVKAASGYDGMVMKPTTFLAGEAGPEHVSITPLSGMAGGSGKNITIVNNIHGSILAEREVEKIAEGSLKRNLKRVGF